MPKNVYKSQAGGDEKEMKKMKKLIFIFLGCVTLGLGTIGVFLPILPTVPFYMITLFCFANSSEKLHNWFLGTSLYKKHLKSFVEHRGMTLKTKLSVIAMVTTLMAFGFVLMFLKGIYIPCIILGCVWIIHILYFGLRVKTIKSLEE